MEPNNQIDSENYVNRELSWLDFNERVLSLVERPDFPLLEKAGSPA
jgi:polyphosphate kinase